LDFSDRDMTEDTEQNPYQPPATDPVAAGDRASTSGPDPRIKDPRNWGWAAITFIWLNCLAITVSWFAPPTPVWQAVLTLSIGVSSVAAIVSYLVWIFRCAVNARFIAPTSAPSPGWAIGCHFVPFANWVVPAMVMKEIADVTFRLRPPKATGYVIAIWWLPFVARYFLESFQPLSPFIPVLTWIAGIAVAWLIVRITLRQVDWRESGLPIEPGPQTTPGFPVARPGSVGFSQSNRQSD
jgi:hypothetical protein